MALTSLFDRNTETGGPMKFFLLAAALVSSNVMARTAGYDCGTFGPTYVGTPETFRGHHIKFKQLAADKDLNKFLFEAVFPGSKGQTCTYGVYLDLRRDTKTLDYAAHFSRLRSPLHRVILQALKEKDEILSFFS